MPPSAEQWSCPACTFLNEPHELNCEICGGPRGADDVNMDISLLPNQGAPQSGGSAHQGAPQSWTSMLTRQASREATRLAGAAGMANLQQTFDCEFCLEKHSFDDSVLLETVCGILCGCARC